MLELNPEQQNRLKQLLAAGAIKPEDLTGIDIRGTSGATQNVLGPMLSEQQAFAQGDQSGNLPMGSMRNEATGKVIYFQPNPQAPRTTQDPGFSDRPYPAMPQQATGASAQRPQIRLAGYGNGQLTDLGTEDARALPIDYTRPGIDIPGVGKARYTADGRYAVVNNPDGSQTKVILGYDAAGSQQLQARDLALKKTQADIAQTEASTAQMGAPRYSLTPEGILNDKTGQVTPLVGASVAQERKRQDAAYQAGVADLKKDDADIQKASALEDAFKTWAALQPNVTTGRVAGYLPAIGNPDRQTLEQLQNFLAINNFKPGQGQISNFERTLIKGAGPNVMNDPETNMDIVKVGLGAVQNMKDRANFREQYLQAKGNLIGSDQAWQKYLDANPRYIRDDATKRIVDNPARQDWQQYFGGGNTQPPYVPPGTQSPGTPEPAATASPAPVPIPKDAIDYLRANPIMRQAFDMKYGAGSAARVLGR